MHARTHTRPRAHTRVGEDESEERRSAVDAAALASVFKAKALSKKNTPVYWCVYIYTQ